MISQFRMLGKVKTLREDKALRALQKARTAMFFSNPQAASNLLAAGGGVAPFVAAMRTFLGDTSSLTGNFAYGNRSVTTSGK